jgi:hypothetical protein
LPLTEAAIQKGLTDFLETVGFLVYHTRYSIGSDPGFPDILAVRDDGTLVAIECKGPKGRIGDAQCEWINRLRSTPGCVFAEVVGPRSAMGWCGYDEALEQLHEALT